MRNTLSFTRTLPNGKTAKVYPFHISTKGAEDKIIFRDEEDLRVAHNLIAICAHRNNVIVLMDCELNTHIHECVLAESLSAAENCINSLKISYSKYNDNKYGSTMSIFNRVESNPILILDMAHLRNTICYIARNAQDAGARVDSYKWSGYRALFCKGQIASGAKSLSSMTRRELRAALHTDTGLQESNMMISNDGIIEPASYIDWVFVEHIFKNDQSYFLRVLGLTDDAVMEQKLVNNPNEFKSIEELTEEIERHCIFRYGITHDRLSYEQLIPIIKIVYYTTRTSVAQLARCCALKKCEIEFALGKRK